MAATEQRPEHSPLGGSGAYRWMKCPGSVGLSDGVTDEESDFAAEGTAAHALAETCLREGRDAWESVGSEVRMGEHLDRRIPVTKEMADAVQVYLDTARRVSVGATRSFIEQPFHCPTLHRYYWGKMDLALVFSRERFLDVTDYKHGAGIVVEAEANPQLRYYGAGILEHLGLWQEVDRVRYRIVQPRGWHHDGPVRTWEESTDDLWEWTAEQLIPAMDRALVSTATASGEHCRFCPARSRACPQIMRDMEEMEALMADFDKAGAAPHLTNEQVGRMLDLFETAKIVAKAANKTAFDRMNAGAEIPGWKLAKARSNREWREGAEAALRERYGDDAVTAPVLKSPAQIEGLPEGDKFTARYAFKPDAGLTVARATDARVGVSRHVKSMFTDQTKTRKGKK